MRIRLLLLALGLGALALPAGACDLSTAHRGKAVADYVEDLKPCMAAMPAGFEHDSAMEAEFLRLVNSERISAGLKPLKLRPELVDVARIHSLDMAFNNFFGHESPDGRMPHQRIAAFDRSAIVLASAENVAMVEIVRGRWNLERKAVDRLHSNLMNSPPHKKNILNPDMEWAAMGVVRTKSGVWITQVFMELGGTLDAPLPVRLSPGEALDARAVLHGWTFDSFEAKRAHGDYLRLDGTIPAGLSGDFDLAAKGMRPADRPGFTNIIHLPGPAATVGG
ncbi:MAG: hypothetical protein KDA53_04375 [Hyphomonas sp.]|nr:hypothetical protein [Hyphomonas sp.]